MITDDTQMAIATAQGVINSSLLQTEEEIIKSIWDSYKTWYVSQANPYERRAPGNTCLSALGSGVMGTIIRPINHSKGCGAIMRAHPVGVAFRSNPEDSFRLGAASGAITHGHPDGYLPSGALAMIISLIFNGHAFESAVEKSLLTIGKLSYRGGDGTIIAAERAFRAPTSGDHGLIIDQQVGGKGGWHGHDALAIALYAVRCAPDDPIKAVKIAANHSGDTDSTASIAGAIVGTMHGYQKFIDELNSTGINLEKKHLLIELAADLVKFGEVNSNDN
jgi:ADP-ribosylglycohydrolase